MKKVDCLESLKTYLEEQEACYLETLCVKLGGWNIHYDKKYKTEVFYVLTGDGEAVIGFNEESLKFEILNVRRKPVYLHTHLERNRQKVDAILNDIEKCKEDVCMSEMIRRIDDLGRIVIPREMRQKLGCTDGDAFIVKETKDGILLKPHTSYERILNLAKDLETEITRSGAELEPEQREEIRQCIENEYRTLVLQGIKEEKGDAVTIQNANAAGNQ